MISFRGLRYFLAPPWLTGKGDGEKVAFTLEWLMDAFLERLRQGLNARFPSRAGDSALSLIVGDRGLLRGRNESRASIAARLKAWRTPRTHKVRGNAFEALLQIWHYWGGIYAATIDSHGLRHVITSGSSTDVNTLADPALYGSWVSGGNTQWDGQNADTFWSRFWIVLQPTAGMSVGAQPNLGDPTLWGGALGTPGYTLGQTGVTSVDVTAMRALFQELAWNPRHTQPEWLVLVFNTDSVDVVPATAWKYWSKDDGTGKRVAARSATYRYWSLDPVYNNTYAGDRTRPYPAQVTLPAIGSYTPSRSNAGVFGAITLPNGSTYAGSRTRWPSSVLLLDDGSIPA